MRSAAVDSAGLYLAGERLAVVHAHVRVGKERRQVVGIGANALPGEGPVERETDLVNHSPLDNKRLDPACHHRAGLDSTAGRSDGHPAAVNDAALGG